ASSSSDVAECGTAWVCPSQSAEIRVLHRVAACYRSTTIFHQGGARTRRLILPVARRPYVASVLGLPGNGGNDNIQWVEGFQPVSALADRRRAREAREEAQKAY